MRAQPENIAGIGIGGGVLLLALGAAGVLCRYMTEYGAGRYAGALFLVALGAGVAVAVYQRLTRHCATRRRLGVALALAAVLIMLPLGSLVYPGRVTYARFGLTVYGLVPVPFLDLTVNSRGVPWFRDKTHWVGLEEVRPMLRGSVGDLVIGTGWENLVEVDPAVLKLDGVRVHALPTPRALALFRQLRAAGKRAVLIVHTTC